MNKELKTCPFCESLPQTNVGEQMMNDLISREKAIEALDFKIVHMTVLSNDEKNITNPFAQYNKGLEDGIKALKDLPSAESEIIPIEEVSNQLGCVTIQSALYWFEFLKTLDSLDFAIVRKETK